MKKYLSTAANRWIAVAVLAAAATICFWRLSLHPTDLLVGPQSGGRNDVTSTIIPFRQYHGSLLSGGGHFAWNPCSLGGMPWLGNPQTALFYPPNWLYCLFEAKHAVSWVLVAHHWLAGLGTYLLCRRYGFQRSSALVAGICFLGAPYYVANTGEGHYNPVCLMAWVPWAFLAVGRMRAGQRGGVALTAAVLALCFFCGHVQELFYLVLIVTAFLAVDVGHCLLARRRRAGQAGSDARASSGALPVDGARVFGRWILAGVALAGITAVDLIPTWIYSRHSVRLAGVSLADLSSGSLEAVSLLQLLDPFVLGGPSDYWGPGLYWESVCHVGLVPLVLSCVGALGGWRRYPLSRFAVLWLIVLLFAFGDNGPLFPLLYQFVPGVSLFRVPSRAMFFCSFLTAVLAGGGIEVLRDWSQQSRSPSLRRVFWVYMGIALSVTVAVLALQRLGLSDLRTQADARLAPGWLVAVQAINLSRYLLLAGGAGLVLGLFAFGGRLSQLASYAAVTLLVTELAWHGGAVLRTIPRSNLRHDNAIVEFLRGQAGNSRVYVGQELLSDREAWRAGIHKVQGYDPVPLARLGMYASALLPRSDAAQQMAGFVPFRLTDLQKPLSDAFGIRYAVLPGEGLKDMPGWRIVQRGRVPEELALRGHVPREIPYAIYENESVLPRAYVVGHALQVQGDVLGHLSRLEPRQQVLLPADTLPPGERQAFSEARIVSYSSSQVTVEAALTAPGYLVLSDLYYTGWSAEVDGQTARILPANVAFRAVALERGEHTVRFTYSPPGAMLGAGVTLATVLLLVLTSRRSRPAKARDLVT